MVQKLKAQPLDAYLFDPFLGNLHREIDCWRPIYIGSKKCKNGTEE
jgi:hypothetical protein